MHLSHVDEHLYILLYIYIYSNNNVFFIYIRKESQTEFYIKVKLIVIVVDILSYSNQNSYCRPFYVDAKTSITIFKSSRVSQLQLINNWNQNT